MLSPASCKNFIPTTPINGIGAGRHVKDKIRQQLQVLRDTGLLLHVERGCWRLP
jgi:hypothetical protein